MIKSCVRLVVYSFLTLGFAAVAATVAPMAPSAFAWDDRPAELYNFCTSCHGMHGEGKQDVGAPSIAGLPAWYLSAQLDKFHNGARGGHVKDINGMRMRPVGRGLDDSNRKVMAEYVAALPRPALPDTVKGNIVKGEGRFQVCQACHGKNAEGNPELNAPPLVNASDWYLLTQLRNFKNRVRGYDPSIDPTGASMQGMAATLDDEGMLDVVAYINALKPVK